MSETAASRACRPGRRTGVGGLGLVLALALAAPAGAEAPGDDGRRILAVGLLAHDRGPASDETEDGGVDLSLEVLFAPLDLPGSPRPHLGATLNFDGETSAAYAGLTARAFERSRWFADLFLGAAVHDGPLHKDPLACDVDSDCGFGVRVLPRFGLEAGYRIGPDAALTVYLDHMSHKWLIGGENEGLDHTGVRYLRYY
ncbi:MAG TPA: acyloxyacyl hydrolase [Thiobacillaceae bacterium]